MPITLTQEQEAEIRADARAHGYDRAEDYLAVRLANMHASSSFSFETEEELQHMVALGVEQADRGELLSAEEAKADIERMKAAYRKNASAA